MKILSPQALAARELKRRKLAVTTAVLSVPKSLLDSLTPPQLAAVNDPSEARAWSCTRRAGKTHALLVALIIAAILHPGSKSIYLSTSIKRAVATVWTELHKLLRDHDIAYSPNESRHFVTLANGSTIHVSGCETRKEADAWRGYTKCALWAVDEGQDWKPDLLAYLLDDVIHWSLADIGGRTIVAGTPGILSGRWYELAHNPEVGRHFWSLTENPYITDAQHTLEEALRVRGCGIDDPSIQREFFGRWVVDVQRMVFPAALQVRAPSAKLQGAVLGCDVGVVDATSCVRLDYDHGAMFITLADQRRGLGSSKQHDFIEGYAQGCHFVVIDPGGGGAALVADFQAEGRTNFIAADKTPGYKNAALRRLRDAIATGRVVTTQRFPELEAALARLEWRPDGTDVLGHCPDIVDALLYAFCWAEKFVATAPAPLPERSEEQAAFDREMEALVDQQEELARLESGQDGYF